MSKYIIDTDDYIFNVDGALIVGFDCDNKPATFYNSLDNLEELNSDYINEHYGQLQDEAYQAGLNDAWEAARKIAHQWEQDTDTEHRLVIDDSISITLDSMTASEAIAKLKAYEDTHSDRIEVGDIVDRYIDGKFDSRGIYLQEDGGYWRCLFNTGAILTTFSYPKEQFKKTGKHYDIQSILEAMRQ